MLNNFIDLLKVADDMVTREIWNGAWFSLSIAMVISFLLISFQRIYSIRRVIGWFYYDRVFQISSALCAFSAASAIRAGYIWLLLHCQNNYGADYCQFIENYTWVLSIGAILAIISGVCVIRILSPPEFNPWIWISAIATAIGGPSMFYIGARKLNFGNSELAAIEGRYDPFLVILSIFISMLAAYAAMELIGRSREVAGHTKWVWTSAAAIAMGGGIWSMHFIGMLSFRLIDVPIGYDTALTAFSLVIPIIVTLIGFLVIKDRIPVTVTPLIISGLFIAAGIVTMHYTGMAAMRMALVEMIYDPLLFCLSIFIAVIASISTVWVSFGGDVSFGIIERKILAAIIGGVAVSGMHYAGMAATTFYHSAEHTFVSVVEINKTELALWVTVALIVMLSLFISTMIVTKRRSS